MLGAAARLRVQSTRPDRFEPCTSTPPPEYAVGPGHQARCYLHDPARLKTDTSTAAGRVEPDAPSHHQTGSR